MVNSKAVPTAPILCNHTGTGQYVNSPTGRIHSRSFRPPQIAEYTLTGHKHRQFR
jgi:hypothetical protein